MRPIRAPNGDDVDAHVQFRGVRKLARSPGPVAPKPSLFNIPLPNERSDLNRDVFKPLAIRLLRIHLVSLRDCVFDDPAFVVGYHERIVLYWDNPSVIVPAGGWERTTHVIPAPVYVIPAKAGIHSTPWRMGAHHSRHSREGGNPFYPHATGSAPPTSFSPLSTSFPRRRESILPAHDRERNPPFVFRACRQLTLAGRLPRRTRLAQGRNV